MRYIESVEELKNNMETLDRYLSKKCESTYSFALGLIKKGTCFVAVSTQNGYRFYPSRFIGYAENTKDKHENNNQKDGRKTNPVISSLLGQKVEPNPMLDSAYRAYCEKLGFTANDKGSFGVERKYWTM